MAAASAVPGGHETRDRQRRPGRTNAIAAVAAQFSQAAASFLLNVLAFRYSGSEGVGTFALAYGIIVLATALVSGLVGDSLTALDRSDPVVRSALQRWALYAAATVAVGMAFGAWLAGTLGFAAAVLFAAAGVSFVVEDVLRRVLMASIAFGRLVVVDVTALVVSVSCVVMLHQLQGHASVSTMLWGLLAGQLAAIAVACAVVPERERWLARRVPPAMAAVWRYGSWRSLQLIVRPAMMAIVRGALVGSVGLALFGRLEAARVFVAPAMLMVSGAASFLFASYANDRTASLAALLVKADRAVVTMAVLAGTAGFLATVLTGPLGGILSDSSGELNRLAVAGWSAYTAATAAVTPYGSLAAIRGRQRAVLAVRVAESAVTIVAVVLMQAVDVTIWGVPFAMAIVALLSGATLRFGVLPALLSEDAALQDSTSSRAVHIPKTVG